MANVFQEDRTWVGFAIKTGGHLFVVGAEGAEGVAGRLDQFTTSLKPFNITSLRFGPGLGGGVGISLFMAFNTAQMITLNNMKLTPSLSDFNVNISVELKVPLSNSFKAIQPIAQRVAASSRYLGAVKTGVGALKLSDISTLRDFAHLYWQAVIEGKSAASTKDSKVIMIDIPGAGAGLELSLFWTLGEITVI